MRLRGFSLVEALVVLGILGILWNILFTTYNVLVSFTSTSMPAMRFQNVELQSVLSDLCSTLQRQRGSKSNYARHFIWENESLKKRRVWLETTQRLPLREIFRRVGRVAQVKFDVLQHPECRGSMGLFIIRDTRRSSPAPRSGIHHIPARPSRYIGSVSITP